MTEIVGYVLGALSIFALIGNYLWCSRGPDEP
jgi:hypothetical protein